jgi:hypothetical protein
MTRLRKLVTVKEILETDGVGEPCDPVARVAAIGVFDNPCAGRFVRDLSALFEIGRDLGERLARDALALLDRPAVSYGKAALVGVAGDLEHGGAVIHPRLGAAMRGAVGGGAALIPSNAKVAAAGGAVDVPLGHKDEAWSFDHFDTLTVSVADAPRPGEIALIVAYADAGRPIPRCGAGPIRD